MLAKINSKEYALHRDYKISEQVGNKTSSTITVDVENQPIPSAGDIVEIMDDNGSCVFWGKCGIPSSPKYKSIYDPKSYKITCGNANTILADRIINIAYQNRTISDVVRAIYDKYIAAEGITLGYISSVSVILESYSAPDYNLQDALNELADLVQGVWKITNDRQFIFLVQTDFPAFPEIIQHDFLIGGELQYKTKDSDTRTVQIISGASDVTDTQTEKYTYDGKQKTFITAYPISEKPFVRVNGTSLASDKVGMNGLDDQNENVVFLFSYNSKNINYKSNSAFLSIGDIVEVSYIGFYNIRVVLSNQTKINEIAAKTGTSGIRERVELARGIATVGDAINKAASMLERFDGERKELSFWVTTAELAAHGYTTDSVDLLTVLIFDLPAIGIVGRYVITERTITAITDNNQKISLKLTDRNYMKSYGQLFNTMVRDIKQLSIRADDVIIDTSINTETTIAAEIIKIDIANAYFPCLSEGCALFAPIDIGMIYPT